MFLINNSCTMSSTDKKHMKPGSVAVSADVVLDQREKDLQSFKQRKQKMDTLIKMIAKVAESLTGKSKWKKNPLPNSFMLN